MCSFFDVWTGTARGSASSEQVTPRRKATLSLPKSANMEDMSLTVPCGEVQAFSRTLAHQKRAVSTPNLAERFPSAQTRKGPSRAEIKARKRERAAADRAKRDAQKGEQGPMGQRRGALLRVPGNAGLLLRRAKV